MVRIHPSAPKGEKTMRLRTKAGVVIDLPAFNSSDGTIELLAICQRDMPRAHLTTAEGDRISVLDLHIDSEEIKSLNVITTGC